MKLYKIILISIILLASIAETSVIINHLATLINQNEMIIQNTIDSGYVKQESYPGDYYKTREQVRQETKDR